MISFDSKPNPDIYDILTRSVELRFDGNPHNVTIHSMSSKKAINEVKCFQHRHNHAIKLKSEGEDILYEKGKVDAGLGVEVDGLVPTKWFKKHHALLAMALIDGYPEDRNLEDDLIENSELCAFIIEQATELQNEYLSKKKS